ncbi:hypothetical protein AB0H00_22000 [Nocardia sp. NPDC023852]|uniref:hypothetical protein n=1 Tax=Nocardia sp. NPDC023852 TaxID=3154697 RepID=UPI0033E4E858
MRRIRLLLNYFRTARDGLPEWRGRFVTAGYAQTSLVVTRDGEVIVMRPGDTVWTPPGEEHWHGAGPESFMTHLALWEGDAVTWAARVTDEEYRTAADHIPKQVRR